MAAGFQALKNVTGGNNIGLGGNAGGNIIAGSNNIDIGGGGSSDESNTIRIGSPGTQTATYIAGVFNNSKVVGGNAMVVNSSGELGIIGSSARYKRDIRDMGDISRG